MKYFYIFETVESLNKISHIINSEYIKPLLGFHKRFAGAFFFCTYLGICNCFFTISFANIDEQKSGLSAGHGNESFTQRSLFEEIKSGGHVLTFHNPRLARFCYIKISENKLKAKHSSSLRAFDQFSPLSKDTTFFLLNGLG